MVYGMLKSKSDDAMFYWLSDGKLEGVLRCYVDDFVWGGSINFEKQIINVLKETFSVSSQDFETFKYLGFILVKKRCHYVPSDTIYKRIKRMRY